MKISYNWLKWYISECQKPNELVNVFNYHICEVEGMEKIGEADNSDTVFDLNILPNRAHDLLSHQGIARELASLLNIKFIDSTSKYKIPDSKPTNLKIEVKSDKCRRYMGRIIRNVKVGPSPEWEVIHLKSIGQRSINNIVDATNIVMYDCGEPCHAFDLDKLAGTALLVRDAKEGEKIITLDDKEVKLKESDMVIADEKNVLAIAGVKGGKMAEVNQDTKNILLEVANFNPISVRKTSKNAGFFTDSSKRFENDISPELTSYSMLELSALILEMCPNAEFEEIVDTYPQKQKKETLVFSVERISKILGLKISKNEVEDILKRYNFSYKEDKGIFEIIVPPMRLDLEIEEDIAEEVGRIIGYDKLKPKIPEINFKPKTNGTFSKIVWARNKLLAEGYSEVMTYVFRDRGEVEVLASASDKKFLRTNLSDGLKESLKLNQLEAPLLDEEQIKIFEIGAIFLKDREEIRIAYNEKEKMIEISLNKFVSEKLSPEEHGYISAEKFLMLAPSRSQGSSEETFHSQIFKPWSVFPFIVRDMAVWVPDTVESNLVYKVIKENAGDLLVRNPKLFDEFKKENKTSYAFRLVFQSYDKTLTDDEVNDIMLKISHKIKENSSWEIR